MPHVLGHRPHRGRAPIIGELLTARHSLAAHQTAKPLQGRAPAYKVVTWSEEARRYRRRREVVKAFAVTGRLELVVGVLDKRALGCRAALRRCG